MKLAVCGYKYVSAQGLKNGRSRARSACARWRESLETYREYNGFAAEAILVNLLPAPARTRGNQARQLAPRARAAARARAGYEIHRECDGSAGPRSVRAARSSGRRKSAKPSARTLRALGHGFALAAAPAEGETLAFFRLFPLRGRPFGGGNARVFSAVSSSLPCVWAGGLSAARSEGGRLFARSLYQPKIFRSALRAELLFFSKTALYFRSALRAEFVLQVSSLARCGRACAVVRCSGEVITKSRAQLK